MNKNMPKYFTYRYAIDQINKAIDAGFFLEAITIEESILVDRLYRFCRDNKMKKMAEKATLGDTIQCIKKISDEVQQAEKIDFLDELDCFREKRNTCLHQIAKSEPGEPTMPFEEFLNLARKTALDGRELTQKVGNWSKRYNRKITCNPKPPPIR